MFLKGRNQLGFSILELLLVLAIIALGTAMAIPSYQGQVQTINRQHAMLQMQQLAASMEQFKRLNFRYPETGEWSDYQQLTSHYQLQLLAPEPQTQGYRIVATPIRDSLQGSDPCGVMVLTQAGEWQFEANKPMSCLP